MGGVTEAAARAPEMIDRVLTREILRGEHAPGTSLPSVRTLAGRFGVNPSTVHRAVSRLEARGLVVAEHGRGLLVADPAVVADLGFLSEWLDALADDPPRACRLLGELLELRRTTASRLLVRHREVLLPLAEGLGTAIGAVAASTASEAAEADLFVARVVVNRSGELVARTVLNSWERAIHEHPDLVAAAYDDPVRNTAVLRQVLDAVVAGGPGQAAAIEAAYATVDEHTLVVYERRLRRRRRAQGR